jgi:hypothetical protein
MLSLQIVCKSKIIPKKKVSSRRINLEGNTHAQESNASQLPV